MQIVRTDKRPNTTDLVWQTTDPFSRQRECPTSTSLQLSNSNKDQVLSPKMGALFRDGLADETVGRNITLTLTLSSIHIYPCGGGVEYLHRDPASRRRRRKGKSKI
jgi:hypothetical protein